MKTRPSKGRVVEQPTEDARGQAYAAQDLEDISKLQKFPPFQRYFARRIVAERDKAAAKVLQGAKLPAQELHDALIVHNTLNDIAQMIGQDEAGAKNVLGATTSSDEDENVSE